MKHAISTNGSQIRIKAMATFLVILEAHLNISCAIKVMIHVLMKWSYRFAQTFLLLNLEELFFYTFEHAIQSLLNKWFFGYPLLKPQQTICYSNIWMSKQEK